MLRALSGRRHEVATGVALLGAGGLVSAVDVARVRFRTLSEAEIRAYVATGEPLDKAGAYAIQGGGAAFVAGLDGDVETVIGLPTALVRRLLESQPPSGR
jgi:septum formation protein